MQSYILLLFGITFFLFNVQLVDAFGESNLNCSDILDKNKDGIPDVIEAKSSINWSYCNLEGKDISKIEYFDYTESERPFDKNGIPYDNHESEFILQDKDMYDFERWSKSNQESILEIIYRNILELFGEEYIKAESKNNFFKGANLRAANLEGANLQNSKIIDSNFIYANLANANLSNANLTGSSFYKANMKNVVLINADLSHVQLYEADLTNAILVGVNLSNSNLCDFSEHHLHGIHHLGAIGVFSGVDLTDAVFNKADLQYVDFRNITLKNTQFLFADLSEAQFSGKDLTTINLSHANLSNADLSNTILSHKNLHNTNLS